jgi:TM2 domain-containing membrane protein YozV
MKKLCVLLILNLSILLAQTPLKIPSNPEEKNPRKALLMSAVLPGSGQFYTRNTAWGIFYSTLELTGITGIIYYKQAGDKKVGDYERYADNHWDGLRWLDDYYGEYVEPYNNNLAEKTHNVNIFIGYKRYTFTEFIQTFKTWDDWQDARDRITLEKEYHFYENISKYKQFKQGWDDWQDYKNDPKYQVIERSSPNQEHYANMRKSANDLLKRSGYFSTALMFNHVISAFDAYIRTTKFNSTLTHNIKLQLVPAMVTGHQGLTLHMQVDLVKL